MLANWQKVEEEKEQKQWLQSICTLYSGKYTFQSFVIAAEDAVKEQTLNSAPITITISITQQMPASTTTTQNATIPFRNINRGSGSFF